MKPQEAISILMLSPCYWRLKVSQRRQLVKEYLASYAAIAVSFAGPSNKKREDN